MKTFYSWIDSKNSKKILIIFSIITILLYITLATNGFGLIINLLNDNILDMKLFYSVNEFYNNINDLSLLQKEAYILFHIIDYVFILFFYPTLVLLINIITKHKGNFLILPFIAMLFDLIENLIIDIELLNHVNNFFAFSVSIITFLKFVFIFLSVISIFYLNIKKENIKLC